MPLAMFPKFLQRKNSGRRARKQVTPVVTSPTLSRVSEHSVISIDASDAPRPVPPPLHTYSQADQFEHHDIHHDGFEDDLHGSHTRPYENLTMSDEGRAGIPRVIRDGDEIEHIHHHPGTFSEANTHHTLHHDDFQDVPGPEFADELGFTNTERSGHSRPTIYIAPSLDDRSSSSQSGGSQKVTFHGDHRSHDRGTPSMHKRAMTTSSRSMPSRDRRRAPFTASSLRNEYRDSPRHASDFIHHKPPKLSRPEYHYEFRHPYLILTDFGHGLEIGNEDDGFMSYEDYRDTAHLRRSREDTYYIIPGSTPVVFHDEDQNEIYRVDAWKYNTPTLRRKQYIVEDENGIELFRVGGSDRGRSSDGGSSRSLSPRVMYLNSDRGSQPQYKNKRSARPYHAATPLARSAIFDDDRTVSSHVSSNPDIIVVNEDGEQIYDSRESGIVARSPLTRSQYATEVSYPSRPDSRFVDEYGRPIEDSPHRSVQYPWGTSSSNTDESYEGSRRRSPLMHT